MWAKTTHMKLQALRGKTLHLSIDSQSIKESRYGLTHDQISEVPPALWALPFGHHLFPSATTGEQKTFLILDDLKCWEQEIKIIAMPQADAEPVAMKISHSHSTQMEEEKMYCPRALKASWGYWRDGRILVNFTPGFGSRWDFKAVRLLAISFIENKFPTSTFTNWKNGYIAEFITTGLFSF